MDNARLKEFVLMELQKNTQPETAKESMVGNINEPLLDKLIAEYCEMNPHEFATLNVFTLGDEETKWIKENIDTAIADGTIERLKYEQVINNAGLAYISAVARELMASFPDTEEDLDLLENEINSLKTKGDSYDFCQGKF